MEKATLQSKLRENESIIKSLRDGWHVIRHGEKIEWFKTAYRRRLFRNLVLTNQRLVFLNLGEIDYEIPLGTVAEAVHPKGKLLSKPYFKLILEDGTVMHVVIECLTMRVLDSVSYPGSAMEQVEAEKMAKEWAAAINLQLKAANVLQVPEAPPPPPPPPPTCSTCGGPLSFIPQYGRYYCYNCRKYA